MFRIQNLQSPIWKFQIRIQNLNEVILNSSFINSKVGGVLVKDARGESRLLAL